MIDKITKITEEIEEVVDVLTNSVGMIITKATPLLAPLASGFTVLFAFYDGGGRILAGIVEYPRLCAGIVGFILMIALEGINFSTTFNRDRVERLLDAHRSQLGDVDANSLVSWAFWLTVALIFGLETMPGIVGYWQGGVAGSDLAFKFGLLVLPFFSKIGARVFSLSIILDNLEGIQDARRNRRQQVLRQAAEFEIEIETMRQEAALKLAQTEAENKQRLEIERLKIEAKLQQKSVKPSVQSDVQSDVQPAVQSGVLNTNLTSTEQRLNALLNTLLDTGWQGASAVAKALSVSRTTVYSDLDTLAGRDLVKIIRNSDGKITNVEVMTIQTELPVPVPHLNGHSLTR